MLNRPELESTYQRLLDYQTRLSTLVGALASFLQVDPVSQVATTIERLNHVTTEASSVPPSASRTKAKPAQPLVATPSPSQRATGVRILTALAKESRAARPGDLVDAIGVSAASFRQVLAELERAGHVTVTGQTISRRVAITDRGRATLGTAPASTGPARTPTDADLVAARDKAIKDRLKGGPATFEQLLAALPGEFPSADEKARALKASLRRLTLRSEVIDVADKFRLAAA